MNYFELSSYVALASGGFVLGALYGRQLAGSAAAAMDGLEQRVMALEHALRGAKDGGAAPAAAHASALEKLAGAIEKHAAAIDDHGAATVAAAVESHAALTASTTHS